MCKIRTVCKDLTKEQRRRAKAYVMSRTKTMTFSQWMAAVILIASEQRGLEK